MPEKIERAYCRNIEDSNKVQKIIMSEDLLAPLMTSSFIAEKDETLNLKESTPPSSPRREATKLGLFSFVGLAIVLFQVTFRILKVCHLQNFMQMLLLSFNC